jgi:Tol biopolymer transport system component
VSSSRHPARAPRIRRVVAPLSLALLAVPWIDSTTAVAATTSATIVSRASSGAQLDGSSETPAMSADGRYVAFATDAEFYPGDENGAVDIFRKDLLTGAILPASVNDEGVFADFDSYSPSISADGQKVAFLTDDDDVLDLYDDLDRDQNLSIDLYVRDFGAGTTRPAFLYDIPGDGDPVAYTPVDGVDAGMISRDGSTVVAETYSSINATEGLDEFDRDVYVRALSGGATRRVSKNPSTNTGGGGFDPSISTNGRFIAFASDATNITASTDLNGLTDIFVFDRDTDNDGVFDETGAVATTRASVATAGVTNGHSTEPGISGDGRYVAFVSQATNLGGLYAGVYLRDRQTNTNSWVSPSFGAPDGSFSAPVVNDGGRYVAFSSNASALVAGDTPGTSDIFRRDVSTATTLRVTEGNNGAQPDGQSYGADISPSGSVVAYTSGAANLVPTDTNANSDAFVWAPLNDLSAPFVSMIRPVKAFSTAAAVAGQWYGFDTSSVGTYDVQRKVILYNQSSPLWSDLFVDSTRTRHPVTAVKGRTYCWRARAEDIHGNLSAYTTGACTALPLSTTSLAFTSGWTRVNGTQYYGDQAYRANSAGRRATRTGVIGERIAVVVTKCNGCGSIRVTFGSSTKTVSLQASSTRPQQVIEVFTYAAPRSGTVTIESLSANPVYVEGVGVYKD